MEDTRDISQVTSAQSCKWLLTDTSPVGFNLGFEFVWKYRGKLFKQCLMAKACVQVFGMEDVHLHSHHHWRLHSRESTQTNLFFSKTQINFPGINLNTSASKCRNGRQTSLFTHVVITSVVGRTYKCQIANWQLWKLFSE